MWEGEQRNPLIFIKRKMRNWTKELFFFLSNFNDYSMIYANVVYIWDPLKQNLVLEFCRKQNKDISVLTGTHSNHDQINQIRNNWFGPIFLLETFTQKDCLLSLIQDLKMSLRLTLIQKGDFYLSRLLSLITDFFVIVPLQGIAPESSWLKDISLKDYKILLWIKWARDGGNKT